MSGYKGYNFVIKIILWEKSTVSFQYFAEFYIENVNSILRETNCSF